MARQLTPKDQGLLPNEKTWGGGGAKIELADFLRDKIFCKKVQAFWL